MRFMIIRKADRDTEAGLLPSEALLAAMASYNEALAKAGVPLVTCRGQAFPGRVAASLVEAAGLPELITGSLEEYESLAGRLAANPDLAAALKAKLASVRTTAPLFDGPRYRKAVEWAYSAMVERARAGQPPDSIVVPGAL